MARSRIWWTKVVVLVCAIGTVFGAWWLSREAWVTWWLPREAWPALRLEREMGVVPLGGLIALTAFAGGLWTTLLLRQVTAAFWFTILVPAAIAVAIAENGGSDRMAFAALGLYSVAGFLWAWRQFLRAQEAGWTGGVISLVNRRAAAARQTIRAGRPIAALFRKELQLHQIVLAGMGGLFLLHLGTVALRRAGPHVLGETLRLALDSFYLFWVVVPLLAGAVSVAEERKLGTMEAQLCIPISSRLQFAIKLLFVVVLGGVLSAALAWVAEGPTRTAVGAGALENGLSRPLDPEALGTLLFSLIAISVMAFFASSLTRNVLQALATAVAAGVILAVPTIVRNISWAAGRILWQGDLLNYVEWPVLAVTLIWLAYGNFRRLSETWRFWLRNTLGVTAALVFITASTAAIYHRAWELLAPVEPAHGPARLTGAKLDVGRALAILLPQGRLWVDRLIVEKLGDVVARGEPTGERVRLPAIRFVDGSNWTDTAVAYYGETVGIRSDGTLWVSENAYQPYYTKAPIPETETFVRFGDETNWLKAVRDGYSLRMLLLRKDGTLWRWGTNRLDSRQKWPGLRSFELYRFGADSDWADIVSAGASVYAWKRDGHAWILSRPLRSRANTLEPGWEMDRCEAFDNTKWRSLTDFSVLQVGVREDGTMWFWGQGGPASGTGNQIGKETNWVAVALSGHKLVALNANGSLWTWNAIYSQMVLTGSPVRLGIHEDWVAIGATWDGTVSLAADGSLWYWWSRDDRSGLLAVSRRPTKIENIFDSRE